MHPPEDEEAFDAILLVYPEEAHQLDRAVARSRGVIVSREQPSEDDVEVVAIRALSRGSLGRVKRW